MKNRSNAYIYQGTSLVLPVNTPDSRIHEEIDDEFINIAFGGILEEADSFIIPAIEGDEDIRGITIPDGDLPEGWKAVPLRQVLLAITGGIFAESRGYIGRILRSHHISLWRKDSRFCGSCGGANRDADSGELARQCTVCGRFEFPRISPAVISIVINGRGEALLAHNKKFTAGVYSLIAGFNEAGESLEATVAREIKEEVNIDVKDIRYVRSQPWPFPNSLMLGFAARYGGGEIKPDGLEIDDARWFSRDSLPDLPGSSSVSRHLINLWIEGKL
ncbi:MAG: NAD(+) diphosphatase [Treponema sp.]|nr:NAD(+) diphosphatase [Treponema sp.]